MNSIALSLVIAVTVEGIMEYLKTLVLAFQNKKYKKLVYYTSSLLLSILLFRQNRFILYPNYKIFTGMVGCFTYWHLRFARHQLYGGVYLPAGNGA